MDDTPDIRNTRNANGAYPGRNPDGKTVGLKSCLALQAIWLRVNVKENRGKKGSNTKRRLQNSEEGQD